MKSRLNLTLEPDAIEKGKRLAAQQNKSLSEWVEEMIKKTPEGEPRILKFLRENPPKKSDYLTDDLDLKEEYAQGLHRKYGL